MITQRSEHDTGVWLAGPRRARRRRAVASRASTSSRREVVCYLARGSGRRDPARPDAAPRRRRRTRSRSSASRASGWSGTASRRRSSTRSATRPPRCSASCASLRPAAGARPRRPRRTRAPRLGLLGALDLGDRRRPLVGRRARDRLDARPDRRRQPAAPGSCSGSTPTTRTRCPWIRVQLSCAIGDALYPNPQWREPRRRCGTPLYPRDELDADRARSCFAALEATLPRVGRAARRPPPGSLDGRSLREVMPLAEREPDGARRLWPRRWRDRHERIRDGRAVAGVRRARPGARARRLVSPRDESRTVATFSPTGRCAARSTSPQICSAHTTALARARRAAALVTPVHEQGATDGHQRSAAESQTRPCKTVDFDHRLAQADDRHRGCVTHVTAAVKRSRGERRAFELRRAGGRVAGPGGRIEDDSRAASVNADWHTANLLAGPTRSACASSPRSERRSSLRERARVHRAACAVDVARADRASSLERSGMPRTTDVALWEVIRESTQRRQLQPLQRLHRLGRSAARRRRGTCSSSDEAATVQAGRQEFGEVGAAALAALPGHRALPPLEGRHRGVPDGLLGRQSSRTRTSATCRSQDAGRTGLGAARTTADCGPRTSSASNGSADPAVPEPDPPEAPGSRPHPEQAAPADASSAYGILEDEAHAAVVARADLVLLARGGDARPDHERDQPCGSRTGAAAGSTIRSRRLTIDPLRPLSNLLWGYIQDEQHRLTVARRAYEYDHHYGLTLYGRAVPRSAPPTRARGSWRRSTTCCTATSIFYKEDDDTTIIADPFPVLNALSEVHLLLAEGAHNAVRRPALDRAPGDADAAVAARAARVPRVPADAGDGRLPGAVDGLASTR